MALVHCLQVSGAAVVLVDEEEGCQRRFNGEREKIEEDLHMKIIALSDDVKREIATLPALRPDDSYRENVKGDSPVGLFYTRYLALPNTNSLFVCLPNPLYLSVEQLAFPKPAPSAPLASTSRQPIAAPNMAKPPAPTVTAGMTACLSTTALAA